MVADNTFFGLPRAMQINRLCPGMMIQGFIKPGCQMLCLPAPRNIAKT